MAYTDSSPGIPHRCRIWVFHSSQPERQAKTPNRKQYQARHTRFLPETPARKPHWPVQTGIQEMRMPREAAGWYAVEKHFAPIPRGMNSQRHPQVAGPSQDKASDQTILGGSTGPKPCPPGLR